MVVKLFIVLSVHYVLVFTFQHQKYLHKTLWNERCKKHDAALNDCNWCWCDQNQRYSCKARVCAEVDMFGHFQDAIQTIDVGMEGHGAWRSTPSACSPGVQYRREDMLCICNEDGNWPNPVCRDALRVLHPVEITELTHPNTNYSCSPTKLYLVGCNVCFCSTGYFDPNLCTNMTCYKNDPLLEAADIARSEKAMDEKDLEIYATCKPNVMYSLGCMPCKCLRNNRLVCQPCTESDKLKEIRNEAEKSSCSGTSKIFNVGCNLCYCDDNSRKVCTVRKCVKRDTIKEVAKASNKARFTPVSAPIDYEDCQPGTMFNIDCNTCRCISIGGGEKMVQCTVKLCNETNNLEVIKHDCVLGTTYQWKCMLCHCIENDGVKVQSCVTDKACTVKSRSQSSDVTYLNGYCDPLHVYTDDCNKCRCLADGETIVCTSKICKSNLKPISVDVVPVKLRNRNVCPKGRSYHLKCNMCFCLSNGNSMCTTSNCGRNKFKVYPVIN